MLRCPVRAADPDGEGSARVRLTRAAARSSSDRAPDEEPHPARPGGPTHRALPRRTSTANASPKSCAGSTPTTSTARCSPLELQAKIKKAKKKIGEGWKSGWPDLSRDRQVAPERLRRPRDSDCRGRHPCRPGLLAEAVAARLITRIVDAQEGAAGVRRPYRGWHGGCRAAAVASSPAATPSTGTISRCGGATSASCRPETPSAMRPRRGRVARQCAARPRSRAPRCSPSERPRTIPKPPPTATRRRWPPLRAPRTTDRSPGSTCSCSAWDRMGTWLRCFLSTRVSMTSGPVIAVHGAPKPPPTRLSLTFPSIHGRQRGLARGGRRRQGRSRRMALGGAGERQVPAAGAYGRQRTLWLLDRRRRNQLPRRPGAGRVPRRRAAVSPRRGTCAGSRGLPRGSLRRRRRCAAPSRTQGGVLYGSLARSQAAGCRESWLAGSPQRGQSHSSGIGVIVRKARLGHVPAGTVEPDGDARCGLTPLGLPHRSGAHPAANGSRCH